MAVRVRNTEFGWVALCAAEFPAKDGDIYLDDGQDHALRLKYIRDYQAEGLIDPDFRKDENEKS